MTARGTAYVTMASVYDRWMDHDEVPYDMWWAFIARVLDEAAISSGRILDLGCGTGRMLQKAADYGFDVIGVDASGDMLKVAQQRLATETSLSHSRMQDFDFASVEPVDAVLSCFDALNYVTDDDDLDRVFSGIGSCLRCGGVFVFDLRSRYTLESNFANGTTGDVMDDFAFVWRNHFDSVAGTLRADVTFFIKNDDGLYRRSDEVHIERAHDHETVQRLLESNGLELQGRFDRYRDLPLSETTDRETWVARKRG